VRSLTHESVGVDGGGFIGFNGVGVDFGSLMNGNGRVFSSSALAQSDGALKT